MSRHLSVIPEAATFDRHVTAAMYRMLGVLGSYANRDGWAWPRLETLARDTGQTEGALSKMIRKLVSASYVEMHYETRQGRRRCMYRILYDRPAATAQAVPDADLEGAEEAVDALPRLSTTASLDENGSLRRVALEESQYDPSCTGGKLQLSPRRQVATFPQKESVLLISGAVERGTTPPPPPAPERWERLFERANRLSTAGQGDALSDALRRMAALGTHRANALAAELEAIESGMHGPATPLEVIAQALHEMAVSAAELRPALIRAYCRRVREGEPAARVAAGGSVGRGGGVVTIGAQQLTPADFWSLCVVHGLTARGQSREAIAERCLRLHAERLVDNAPQFLSLVMHVRPWALAEIQFERTRLERVAAAVVSWQPAAAVA